ncbi:MAG: hypothetical protein Tsb0015_11940 [Simkaniaceae bacterium]
MKKQFTATAYILHQEQVLLLFHPKLGKWLPPGGHVEENETPAEAAKREVLEETGLEIEFILDENIWIKRWNAASFPRPYLCLLEEIPAYKNQPAHQHMDFIYLARPKSSIKLCPEENHTLQWFTMEEMEKLKDDEEIFVETKQVLQNIFSMQPI